MNYLKRVIKNNYRLYILGLVWSFIILMVCSKNSFLYLFNDWVDANAFFTVGKSMMNGVIPYKDIFEQKGPLLYFLYGLGYLIDNDGFIGIFIFEIIFMAFDFVVLYKISNLYLNKNYSLLISLLMIPLICSNISFVMGGSAEEFCYPIFAYGLYSFLKDNGKYKHNKKVIFINGFLAGCLAMIKFNFLAFPFAWITTILLELLINKDYKTFFKDCGYFLLGMFIPIGIFILYFLINDALYDFINVYFIVNITAYTTVLTLSERIVSMLYWLKEQMLYFPPVLVLNGIWLLGLIFKWFEKNIYSRLFIIYSYGLLVLALYFGGKTYKYYFLTLLIYVVFGLITIICILNKYIKININNKFNIISYCLVLILSIYLCSTSVNVKEIGLEKSYFAQYEFKEIIEESDDQTVLQYNSQDGGFYTLLNQVPVVKYFESQNIDYDRYPYVLDGQNEYLKNKTTKYVIVREYWEWLGYHNYIPELNDGSYKLIAEHNQITEGVDFDYFLYERVD